MQTSAWGPPFWETMFMVASNYPLKIECQRDLIKKKYYKNFFTNLKDILPCVYCRRSYKKFLKEIPLKNYLGTRRRMVYWVYLLKNKVNKKLLGQYNKGMCPKPPIAAPPFKKIYDHYDKFRAKCTDKTQTCSKPIGKVR